MFTAEQNNKDMDQRHLSRHQSTFQDSGTYFFIMQAQNYSIKLLKGLVWIGHICSAILYMLTQK